VGWQVLSVIKKGQGVAIITITINAFKLMMSMRCLAKKTQGLSKHLTTSGLRLSCVLNKCNEKTHVAAKV